MKAAGYLEVIRRFIKAADNEKDSHLCHNYTSNEIVMSGSNGAPQKNKTSPLTLECSFMFLKSFILGLYWRISALSY